MSEIGEDGKYTPEQILDKIGFCGYRLEKAHKELKDVQKDATIRQQKAKVVIMAGAMDLITNEKLKGHLAKLREEKTRITNEILDALVYIETQEVSERLMLAEKEIKMIRDEAEIWKNMLMEHQSKRKFKGIEMGFSGEAI